MAPPSDYTSTARALAIPIDEPSTLPPSSRTHSTSPVWSRRPSTLPHSIRSSTTRAGGGHSTWLQRAENLQTRFLRFWSPLTLLQKLGLALFTLTFLILANLGLLYSSRIFHALAPAAKKWRDLRGGWLILWFMTFFISFPPMIGYSTCVTIAGFVFGLKGWFIVATATILGSTASFLASRTLLKSYVTRLTANDTRFTALSLVLKHDGLKLLCMIRLCPLPYSLSNGAISTIPSVTWGNFMLATAVVSPKLLLHVFIGGRLGAIADEGEKMDRGSKVVSYVSIAIGMLVGVGTGYVIYVRTKARAKVLEAEGAAAGSDGRRRSSASAGPDYIDDPDETAQRRGLGRERSDISLRSTYEDDLEQGPGGGYRDAFTDDEDAEERDVFDLGDGAESGEEEDLGSRRTGGR